MTIQECYKEMGGDFEGVQKRFGGVALVEKFAIKFLSDSSFQDLEDGLKEKDAEKAFRAAHTLKGICLNLGFDAFYEVSAALTEKLRGRELTGYEADFASVKECYEKTVGGDSAFFAAAPAYRLFFPRQWWPAAPPPARCGWPYPPARTFHPAGAHGPRPCVRPAASAPRTAPHSHQCPRRVESRGGEWPVADSIGR